MRISRCIFLLVISLFQLACEDRYYKKRYDIDYRITNKTDQTLPEIRVDGNDGAKVWSFKNVAPGKTEKLTFNIRKDLGGPDGSLVITAFLNSTDSLYLGAAYYSNWSYYPTDPTDFEVFKDHIGAKK